ncbi:arabinose transporter [Piscinibacter defluvii]|uniref:arabinose transporter n=1 Tax=Piscinibacter defluvii TaxID=1796922 RepID=UPI000FDED607|nr:arabinose transporter [Piscinibacter defluvii]
MQLEGAALSRALAAPMALVFVVFSLTGLAMPVLPLHVHRTLGFSTFVVGWIAGSQFAAALATRLWAGNLSDTRGTHAVMRIGLWGAAASGVLYLLSLAWPSSPEVALALLFAGRALLGGSESFVVTSALAWGLARAVPGEAGRVMAWIGIAMYASFALAAPLGAGLHAWQGFGAIGLAGLLLPLLALGLLRVMPRLPPTPRRADADWRVGLRNVWLPGFGLALSSLGFAATTTFIALLFAERAWTPGWLGFSAFAAAFAAVRVLGGRLPDRLGAVRVALGSLLLEAAGLALIGLAGDAPLAVAGATLVGAGYSLVYPGFGLQVVRRTPAEYRALAMGGFTACLDLALGLGGPALGLLADRAGLATVFGAAAGSVLLAAIVALHFVRRGDEAP